MYKLTCQTCGKEFECKVKHGKNCSRECRKEFFDKTYCRKVEGIKLATSTTGAISEILVSADLMRKGYAVFRALSPACFCDIIAFKDGKSFNIEVRTGYRNLNGVIGFPKNIQNHADYYGVLERNEGEIQYFTKDFKQIELN